jgi:hypothetical protein
MLTRADAEVAPSVSVNTGIEYHTTRAVPVVSGIRGINVKEHQFKYSVNDDQIMRQKLQTSNLLILEMILHITWHGTALLLLQAC